MNRIIFLVEGQSELNFVHKKLLPYLYSKGYINAMHAQLVITSRKLLIGGGVISYDYARNDITNLLKKDNAVVTTFFDFFRLPTNFPYHSTNRNEINRIEEGIFHDFEKNNRLIPYIQLHEFEALLFSNISAFEQVLTTKRQFSEVKKIYDDYQNPELINSSPNGAPSKRLERIFDYNKVVDSEIILSQISIEDILAKCPRFANWIARIETFLIKTNFV